VRGATKVTYDLVMLALVTFVQKHRLPCGVAAEKDPVLASWLDHLYPEGHNTSPDSKVMASLVFHRPGVDRLGSERSPRAWRCLKGWRLLASPRSRVPRAWPLIADICMSMRRQNKVVDRGAQGAVLWSFTYREITKEIRAISAAVGVRDVVSYWLRHAKPTWGRLQAIQQKNRWRSFLSVTRFDEGARIDSNYLLLAATLRRRWVLQACDRDPGVLGMPTSQHRQ
jgi:hypothetical protein